MHPDISKQMMQAQLAERARGMRGVPGSNLRLKSHSVSIFGRTCVSVTCGERQ
jgi:hypothetical protein